MSNYADGKEFNTVFLLSSNPANLTAALSGYNRTATVEAEYGDTVVEGNILTLAHHGSRSGNPAPCSHKNGAFPDLGEINAVGLSHIDLDTIGGCAVILGVKPIDEGFWKLAEFIDLNGAHKIGSSGASPEDIRKFNAYWAWNERGKVYSPKDGSVLDVTLNVFHALRVIEQILSVGEKWSDTRQILLSEGDAFIKEMEELNRNTFVEVRDEVILRVTAKAANHLYTTPDGRLCKVVVSFNTLTGSVTTSFADDPKGKCLNAREIMQSIFGSGAGGHAGIAGSPRDKRATIDQLKYTFDLAHATAMGL